MSDKNLKFIGFAPEYKHFYSDAAGVSIRDDSNSTFELMFMRNEVRPAYNEDDSGNILMTSHQTSTYSCSVTVSKETLISLNSVITQMLEIVDKDEQQK